MRSLICYRLGASPIEIVKASPRREWMSQTTNHFADRCLPLRVANQSGWLFLNPYPFSARWDGSTGLRAISLEGPAIASSHFGEGILTFHLPFLFQGDDPIWVKGPANQPKDGIYPLEGVVETSDNPATFTMNWLFTRPGEVIFKEREPFCMVIPQPPIGFQEDYEPELRDISENPELAFLHARWAESRAQFNAGPREAKDWEKHYFKRSTQKLALNGFAKDVLG